MDDDRTSRALLRAQLDAISPGAVVVDEAADGEEGARLLQARDYDPVVVDHVMPGMIGLDLLAEARRRQPGAARILMTAYGTMPLAVEAINRGGVTGYLHKPLRAAEIARVLGEVFPGRNR